MDLSNYVTVVPIIIICYLAGTGCKTINKLPDKFIPVILGVLGGALGVAGMYVMPDFPAEDIMTSIAVGIMSGLASTGVNQVYKQIGKSE